jgi:hypothetical protein
LFNFVNECFDPIVKRENSSNRYNFKLWGYALAPLVTYFKEDAKTGGKPDLAGLYAYLGVE